MIASREACQAKTSREADARRAVRVDFHGDPGFLLGSEQEQWPAAGFVDTEIGCFMKLEVAYAAKTVWA